MPLKLVLYYNNILMFFLMLFFTKTFSKNVFNNKTLLEEISLCTYTINANVGLQKMNNQYMTIHCPPLNSKKNKTKSDNLGFTKNNCFTKMTLQNPTDLDLHYYSKTLTPLIYLTDLCVVSEAPNKILKQISDYKTNNLKHNLNNYKSVFNIGISPKSNVKPFVHFTSKADALKMQIMLRTHKNSIRMALKELLLFGFFYIFLITDYK